MVSRNLIFNCNVAFKETLNRLSPGGTKLSQTVTELIDNESMNRFLGISISGLLPASDLDSCPVAVRESEKRLTCVASVSSRVIARNLEREPPPPPSFVEGFDTSGTEKSTL